MLNAGATTYFMDVKEAKNSKKYLTVTASQLAKEGEKKFTKRSVIVFSSVADEFVSVRKEAKNNTRYVSISESQPSKEAPKKLTRKSITVFNNAANDFVGAVKEAAGQTFGMVRQTFLLIFE